MIPTRPQIAEATAKFVEWSQAYGYTRGHRLLCDNYNRDIVTAVETGNQIRLAADDRGTFKSSDDQFSKINRFRELHNKTGGR